MTSERPFTFQSDEWSEVREGLEDEEKLGMLALEDGKIENGSVEHLNSKDLYLGPVDRARGRYLAVPASIVRQIWEDGPIDEKSVLMPSDSRNSENFYIGSRNGSPVEIKYDEELPDSEDWHAHSSFEAYVPSGSISLGLIEDFESQEYEKEKVDDGEVFVVPPYVQHKLLDADQETDLAVLRYGGQGISKFDLNGNSIYDWSDVDEFERVPYEG